MYKQSAAIFLLIAFVAQTFSNGFVMLDYYINKVAFVKNCVNKAQPAMHCNGKCQMMKKLQEEEKKDQQMPERKLEKRMELLSSNSFRYSFEFLLILPTKATRFQQPYPLKDISYSFFHPPQA